MVALTGDEAGALRDRLAQVEAAQPAGGTLSVSANASTSVTFTDVEKVAVLDVLAEWMEPTGMGEHSGLLSLRDALARDLDRG
jgi:hypothetical protein